MSDPHDNTLTRDAFLGGKVHVLQPRKGFRSGVDAVLLAASVPAKAGDHILEIGCGAGVGALCLHARIAGLRLTGIEVQPRYADLAQRNVASNRADMHIVTADLRALPADLRQQQFTHVMMNPPYFDRASGPAAQDPGRNIALAGDTPLADWIDVGIRRLAPKGSMTVIQHITRLPEVLAAVQGRLGTIHLQPLSGRAETPPNLFILQARHSGKSPFSMRKTIPLHRGEKHGIDGESYTTIIQDVLRNGAALGISD